MHLKRVPALRRILRPLLCLAQQIDCVLSARNAAATGGICSLYGTETMVSFNVFPLVTPTMIYVFMYVDILAHSY